MTPQPDTADKQIPTSCNGVINDDVMLHQQQITVVDQTGDSNESSDEHEYFDMENNTEYAGYKLLQQDDGDAMTHTIADDSSDQSDASDDETDAVGNTIVNSCANVEEMSEENLDINYQDLVCSGIDDVPFPKDLSASGNDDVSNQDQNQSEFESNETIRNMSEEHAEKVKNAMIGFQLPSVNIPNWAKNISDDEWKKSVLESVKKNK